MSVNNEDDYYDLFTFVTRIDERIKNIQIDQSRLEKKIEENEKKTEENEKRISDFYQKLSITDNNVIFLKESEDKIDEIKKRFFKIEEDHGRNSDRWRTIGGFLIQLIWVILAAYLLTKLNLQSPAIP